MRTNLILAASVLTLVVGARDPALADVIAAGTSTFTLQIVPGVLNYEPGTAPAIALAIDTSTVTLQRTADITIGATPTGDNFIFGATECLPNASGFFYQVSADLTGGASEMTINGTAAGGTYDVSFLGVISQFKDPACSQMNSIDELILSGTSTWSDVPVGNETAALDTGDFYPTGELDVTGDVGLYGISTETPLVLDPTGIPEPASLSLLGGSLIALAALLRRRRAA